MHSQLSKDLMVYIDRMIQLIELSVPEATPEAIKRYCRLCYMSTMTRNPELSTVEGIKFELTSNGGLKAFLETDHKKTQQFISIAGFGKYESFEVLYIYLSVLSRIVFDLSLSEIFSKRYGYIGKQADDIAVQLFQRGGIDEAMGYIVSSDLQQIIKDTPVWTLGLPKDWYFYSYRRFVVAILLVREVYYIHMGDLVYNERE